MIAIRPERYYTSLLIQHNRQLTGQLVTPIGGVRSNFQISQLPAFNESGKQKEVRVSLTFAKRPRTKLCEHGPVYQPNLLAN